MTKTLLFIIYKTVNSQKITFKIILWLLTSNSNIDLNNFLVRLEMFNQVAGSLQYRLVQ